MFETSGPKQNDSADAAQSSETAVSAHPRLEAEPGENADLSAQSLHSSSSISRSTFFIEESLAAQSEVEQTDAFQSTAPGKTIGATRNAGYDGLDARAAEELKLDRLMGLPDSPAVATLADAVSSIARSAAEKISERIDSGQPEEERAIGFSNHFQNMQTRIDPTISKGAEQYIIERVLPFLSAQAKEFQKNELAARGLPEAA